MKELVLQHARELGFEDCRITSAAPPRSGTRLREWLERGAHGEMAYLERNADKRVDLQKVVPGAKSVIIFAASYATGETIEANCLGLPTPGADRATATSLDGSETTRERAMHHGVVARYARYTDYHEVLGVRLKQMADFIDRLGGAGARSLWYVDTGPILERDLAQRSGLGFIGKHTNLISRRWGNWIFLAEIITTLELEPDEPETNRCGSCTRCLSACPTQAIRGPFQLDARRCISYLTIELKGPIPEELRPALGNRIYGCDDCLAVCPWNRFAGEGRLMRSHAKQELAQPELTELLSLSDVEFKRRFAGTPILRAKRRGFLRNVCVALGNIADETALPALEAAEADPEPLIAEHARWAIEQIRRRSTGQTSSKSVSTR